MSKNILVIGSINIDYVIHTNRLPKLGETIVGSEFSINNGGKGANQASAVAKSGCSVKMLGSVGTDISAPGAIKNLESFGVDCSSVKVVEGPTGAAVITVCGGDNEIILDNGANDAVTPEYIKENEKLFDWADIIVMQFEIPMDSIVYAAKLAQQKHKMVILNPAPVKDCPKELYQYIDWIIPNEFECQLLTGIYPDDEHMEEAIKALLALGCKNALITRGKLGCVFTDKNELKTFGIYKSTRVDTTAAGDSFIGGLCSKFCEGKGIVDAVKYATAVSAITISRKGAAVSIPTESEVLEFLKTATLE